MRSALTDDDPLRALWRINSDSRRTILNTEFVALANHRKAIGAELKAYAERVRDIETAAVATRATRKRSRRHCLSASGHRDAHRADGAKPRQ